MNGKYFRVAKEYAKEISSKKGVMGITVGGGIGRGHSDEFSDIDLFIFLDSSTYQKWLKKSPIPKGDHYWKNFWVETEFLSYKEEKEKAWRIEDRWERQHHIIFFDKKSKIKNLLKEKITFGLDEKEKLLKHISGLANWYVSELPNVWIKRGNIAQAHYVLNIALDWILDCVFLKNNYFVPWAKWKLHYALLMKKLPDNFAKNILASMKIKDFTEKDILRRKRLLVLILKQLNLYKKEK